jgi:TIR domain
MSKVRIFVSYAHADFVPLRPYNDSRVLCILDAIKHGLRCHDQRSVFAILRDREGLIPPGYNIDQRIDEAIAACDIGLVLLSKSYCDSEECRAELHKLLAQDKYLVIVETENIWDDLEGDMRALRPRLERTLRVPFYGNQSGKFQLFGHPLPQLRPKEELTGYLDAIDQVVNGIETRARDITAERRSAQGLPPEEAGPHTVFLAYATADVRNQGKSLAQALENAGHSTLCFSPSLHVPPGTTLEQAIKLAVAKCELVVQLLGGLPGTLSIVPRQYEIAQASGKPFLVWRSPEFDPSECGADYGDFLKSAQSHHTSFEEFQQYAIKQADAVMRTVKARKPRAGDGDRSAPPSVVIDVAEPDVLVANLVAEALVARAVVAPLDFEIDRAKLEEAVTENDGIVLVCTDGREGQARINAHFPTVKKIKYKYGLLDIAIGDGGGPDPDMGALRYPRGPNVHVIKIDRQQMKVDTDNLEKFFASVRENAARRFE